MADPTGDDEGHSEIALQQCAHLEREPLAEGRVLDVVAPQTGRQRDVVHGCGLLERARERACVVDRQAAWQVVVAAEPHAERIVVATARADLLDDLDEDPQPPLERAAVGVSASVRLL